MDLVVASNAQYDIQDCTLIDSQSQQAIYKVYAKRSSIFTPPTTYITRFVGDYKQGNVAIIEWKAFGKAKVRWPDGTLVDDSALLEKHGLGRLVSSSYHGCSALGEKGSRFMI